MEMIDTTFNFQTDTPVGMDPDSHSPTLRRYHRLLWSKPLPSGKHFDLSDATPSVYLHHRSNLGEFLLSSDTVIPSFTNWTALDPITRQLPDADLEAFDALAYTIGGMMIFPGNQIDRKWTLNQARGLTHSISDRFDLTVECIRRHYAGKTSPLSETISRYSDFFSLFGDFPGYVDYFLLDDLVDTRLRVQFFMPFDDFQTAGVPKDVDTYREFRHRSMEFIAARNERIGLQRV
jgi:hypothetical protein